MKLGRRVWGAGKILLLIGALGATYLLFFSIAMRVAMRAGLVQVPDFRNRPVSEATSTAADLELGLRIEDRPRPSDTVPVGHITQQEPAPGVEVRPQRTIRVWVSSGPQVTTVPSLVGQSERTVRLNIQQDRIATIVSEIRSADYPPDTVVAQDPPAMARAAKVAMLVNRTDAATGFVMPDVTGMEARSVDATLSSRGFLVTTTAAQNPPGVAVGLIVSQKPAAGSRVVLTDPVVLEVVR
jgi:serine/threonine-protein kinase